MKTAFLTANYLEPKADTTFKGLELYVKGEKEKRHKFNTGDPIVDFYNYKKWMAINAEKEGIFVITHSSSIDHFYMDSKKYVERVVVFNKDYSDGELLHWQDAQKRGLDIDKLITCCVTSKMKTWKELKEYVKSK